MHILEQIGTVLIPKAVKTFGRQINRYVFYLTERSKEAKFKYRFSPKCP